MKIHLQLLVLFIYFTLNKAGVNRDTSVDWTDQIHTSLNNALRQHSRTQNQLQRGLSYTGGNNNDNSEESGMKNFLRESLRRHMQKNVDTMRNNENIPGFVGTDGKTERCNYGCNSRTSNYGGRSNYGTNDAEDYRDQENYSNYGTRSRGTGSSGIIYNPKSTRRNGYDNMYGSKDSSYGTRSSYYGNDNEDDDNQDNYSNYGYSSRNRNYGTGSYTAPKKAQRGRYDPMNDSSDSSYESKIWSTYDGRKGADYEMHFD